jgi:PhoH-like ATPase
MNEPPRPVPPADRTITPMRKKDIPGKRLLVLDTNVLMHDPAALFRFQEHDVFLPKAVLE